MRVEMGTDFPTKVEHDGFPRVVTMQVPETYTYVVAEPGARMTIGRDVDGRLREGQEVRSAEDLAREVAMHMGLSPDGITQLPDQEALLAVIASWRAEASGRPLWVWSDNEDFAVLVGAFFQCPVGRPGDVERTHHTEAGPPGVGPRDADADAAAAVVDRPNTEEA